MNFCVIYTPDYRHRHPPISTSISPTVRLHPAHAKHHSVQGGMMLPPNALSACHFDRMSLILCSRHSVAVKSRRLPLVLTCAQSAKRLSAHPLFHDTSMISKWNHEFHGIWDGPLHISLVARFAFARARRALICSSVLLTYGESGYDDEYLSLGFSVHIQ